jgi:WD40 repeat protein
VAWLRRILARTLVDAVKRYERDKRDIGLERSLEADMDRSASGFAAWLAADQTSPSGRAERNEELLRMVEALVELPEEMREVVVLKLTLVGMSAAIVVLLKEILMFMRVARIRFAARGVLALGILAWTSPVLLAAGQTERDAQLRTDRHGDPLPSGAAMRLGTVRYRQDERIERIAYSPDGRYVVTDNGNLGLQVWDARDGRKVRRLDLDVERIHDFAFSPDGKTLVAACLGLDRQKRLVVHRVIFTDFASGREIARIEGGQDHAALKLAFAPDGKTIATIGDTLRCWDVASGKLSFEADLGRAQLREIAFSPDAASHLVAVSNETVQLWNVIDRREERQLKDPEGASSSCLAFSPDGKLLAKAAGFEGAVQLWRVADGRPLERLTGKNQSIHSLAFSPDGKHLAATGREGHLSIWDLETGEASEPFATDDLADGPLAFSPDGRTIATRGGDCVLHFWDRTNGTDRLATPEAHLGTVQALLFLDKGKALVSGSDDHTVRIWDLSGDPARTGRQRAVLKHSGWMRTLALSRNQQWLVTGSSYPSTDKEPVHLWHVPTGKLRRKFPSPGESISPIGARFSDEGDSILVCWNDGKLRSWDIATTGERATPEPKFLGARPQFASNFARSALFSPDGRRLAVVGNMSGGVHVAELEQGRELFAVPRGYAVAFSPDGRSLAVAEATQYQQFKLADGRDYSGMGPDTVVLLVNGITGQEHHKILVKQASNIEAVAFSPDGKTLAVGRGWNDPDIHLYNVADGREVGTVATPPRTHTSFALAFTPDGKQLITGMSDTSILIWNVRQPE